MNLVFFIVLVVLIGGGVRGYKNGMVKEISAVISMVMALAAIVMFVTAVQGYMEHQTARIALGIICMTIAILVYRIADFIFSSLKLVASIPGLRGIDRLLGFATGGIEAVLIIWSAFLLIVAFDPGGISVSMMADVRENAFLSYLFQNNYLADVIAGLPVNE